MSQLSVIRNNVRRNLGEATSEFYKDTELNQFIGEAYRHYSIIMIEQGDGYFETTTNLGFTANVNTIDVSALNPPFYSVSQFYRRVSNGVVPLRPEQNRYQAIYNNYSSSGDSYIPTYKLRGMSVVLDPPPNSTEAGSATTGMRLDYNYIPTFPDSSSADSFTFDDDFQVIFEPMIELYATIAALESRDGMGGVSDISSFRGRLQKWEIQFQDALSRDETPERVAYAGVRYDNFSR